MTENFKLNDETFEDLFRSLDDIENKIICKQKSLAEESFEKLEVNLNQINVSLNRIEKRFKTMTFFEMKKTFGFTKGTQKLFLERQKRI